jgi:hypothetical protein
MTRRTGTMALAAETILAALMSLTLRLTHRAMPPAPAMAVAVRIAVTGLPHGEFRFFPLRCLAFRAWQRRPDQSAVNGTLVFNRPFIVDAVMVRRGGVSSGLNSERRVGLNGCAGPGIEFIRTVIGP